MGEPVLVPGQKLEAPRSAQPNTEESNEGIRSSDSKKAPPLILRRILKEASIRSPLASAPLHEAFGNRRDSKEHKKLFHRISKQRDELLKNIKAQDRFATQKEERGLLCWWDRGESPDGDGDGAIKYAWLSRNAQTGFRVSSEFILYIECVNPSKTTSESGYSSSGAFVEVRRFLHASVDADDENPGIYSSTSTNNPSELSICINDVPIEINIRVGPLPSFAVIELHGSSIFWWRTKEALDFDPKVGWRDIIIFTLLAKRNLENPP